MFTIICTVACAWFTQRFVKFLFPNNSAMTIDIDAIEEDIDELENLVDSTAKDLIVYNTLNNLGLSHQANQCIAKWTEATHEQ